MTSTKAAADDFSGRFREIISDPMNLLIDRVPDAGVVRDGRVTLHNGNRVPLDGPAAYYGDFSRILIYNRGFHEPLEEYAFQEVVASLDTAPVMLELGAYWAHYSMWLKRRRPQGTVVMVEPEADNIAAGKANFAHNGHAGEFLQALVGTGQFAVDTFRRERSLKHLDIVHADIQGAELEMLRDCENGLRERAIGHLFVSTHSQQLHGAVTDLLGSAGYRIELDSDFDNCTTAYDGLVYASSPQLPPLFAGLLPLGRTSLAQSTPAEVLRSVAAFAARTPVSA